MLTKEKTQLKPALKEKKTEQEKEMRAGDYKLLRIRCETVFSAKPFDFHTNMAIKRLGQRAMQEYNKLTQLDFDEWNNDLKKLKETDKEWKSSEKAKELNRIYIEILEKKSTFNFNPVVVSIPAPADDDYVEEFSEKEGFKIQVPVQFKENERPVILDSFTVFGILIEEGFITVK